MYPTQTVVNVEATSPKSNVKPFHNIDSSGFDDIIAMLLGVKSSKMASVRQWISMRHFSNRQRA